MTDSKRRPLSPPWVDLVDESALRRLARLASLESGEVIAWIGDGGEAAKPWAKEVGCKLRVFADTAEFEAQIAEEEAALVVSPEAARTVGFDETLGKVRRYLRFDGAVGLVCRAFLGKEVPPRVRDFFGRHHAGELRAVKDTLSRFGAQGYEPLTVEILPEEVWVEYYRRLGEALATETPEGIEKSETLTAQSEELALFTAAGRTATTLGLFVGRRLDPDAPPRWPRRGFSD
jgi:hypothetical protein